MKRNIQVGLFVLAGLILSGLVMFMIGDQRRLFERHVELTSTFKDVQGLKSGAPIRMGGVDIGQVTEVGYGKSGDNLIHVKLSVVSAEADRIRADSLVRVAAKGLLGDKMIEITRGNGGPANRDQPLPSEEPSDMFGAVGDIANDARGTMKDVRRVAEDLADEKLQADLKHSIQSLNRILSQIADGDGYPHRLLTDKAEADRISHMVTSFDSTAAQASALMGELNQVAGRVRSGPGFTHDVIYGQGPQKEIAAFGFAADELGKTLKGVRESESLTHDMLYGGKGSGARALENVTAMTDDLRVITAGIRAGKGTLGALLVDPSVYEDMKVVLGNVERNDVLRALVRYSIKQDERKPEVKVGSDR